MEYRRDNNGTETPGAFEIGDVVHDARRRRIVTDIRQNMVRGVKTTQVFLDDDGVLVLTDADRFRTVN